MEPSSSLDDYRRRKAQSREYHPSQWVWQPSDAVETAQAFYAELANAERGEAVDPWWISHSRARKARWYNRIAVALLLGTFAFLGAVIYAASARADGPVDAWTAEFGYPACDFLDQHNTLTGFSGLVIAAEDTGLTPQQAGEAVATSVLDICPRHRDLLRQFVVRYGPRTNA